MNIANFQLDAHVQLVTAYCYVDEQLLCEALRAVLCIGVHVRVMHGARACADSKHVTRLDLVKCGLEQGMETAILVINLRVTKLARTRVG